MRPNNGRRPVARSYQHVNNGERWSSARIKQLVVLSVVLLGAGRPAGADDAGRLQFLYDAARKDAVLVPPAGTIWPRENDGARWQPTGGGYKSVLWDIAATKVRDAADGQPLCAPLGDDDLTRCYAGGALNLLRRTARGDPGGPLLHVELDNGSSAYRHNGQPYFQPVPAFQIDVHNENGANGSLIGEEIALQSDDGHPFEDENVGYGVNITRRGHASTWQFSGQTQDATGLPPDAFSSVGLELDLLANGPDDPASRTDPGAARRWFLYLAPKTNPVAPWTPGMAVQPGTTVLARGPNNVRTVYVAAEPGRTGNVAPHWPLAGSIRDGSATWRYGEPFAMSVGAGIWLDNGESDETAYSAGLATNGRFDDAVIDLSRAILTDAGGSGTGAAIRIAPNQPIDLSATARAGGQNRHTLTFSTAGHEDALVYSTPSGPVLRLSDRDGGATFAGPVRAPTLQSRFVANSVDADLGAAGRDQSSASVMTAQDNLVTRCPDRAGVRLPAAGVGIRIRVLNRSGRPCLVYPPIGQHIEALINNAPMALPARADAMLERFSEVAWYR